MDMVIVIERKCPGRWDYGLAGAAGKLIKVGWAVAVDTGHDISHDDQGLWPTVLLLLRQQPDEERIEYPSTPSGGARQRHWPICPTPPPSGVGEQPGRQRGAGKASRREPKDKTEWSGDDLRR